MTRAVTACRATPLQSDTAHHVSTYAGFDMSDAADDEVQSQPLGSPGSTYLALWSPSVLASSA